ncbi:MAG: DUF5684 domain-containing protein [Oscillospiraceae bacterium]|nr:DUF5684 domain-containing protein [Oscillospiraceae bacterium]
MQYLSMLAVNYSRYGAPSFLASVLLIIGLWVLFSKAREPGWASVIPIYNCYVLFKITWGNGLLALLLLIPFVNAIVLLATMFKLAKVFGKGTLFGLGMIFFSPIFTLLLAFDGSRYEGP